MHAGVFRLIICVMRQCNFASHLRNFMTSLFEDDVWAIRIPQSGSLRRVD
jgi:hypothetical protein